MTNNTTAPALTDERIDEIAYGHRNVAGGIYANHVYDFARDVERALLTSPRAAVPADWRKAFETAMAGIPVEDGNATSFIRNGDDSYVQRHVESAWLGFSLACQMLDAAPAAPVAFASPAFSEDQIAEIARKCELESHACPGSTMFMCAEMAVEETLEAISKQSKRLSVAAIYKALNEFELVCDNNDVRKLTEDEKYAAQEFALSLIHGDPSVAQAVAADGAIPTPDDVQSWAVMVEVNGMTILTISDSHVGGNDSIGDFGDVVRNCAQHLISFIGKDDAERAAVSPATAEPDEVRAHVKWLHSCLRDAGYCIDGGKCHHECGSKGDCFRQAGCVPLTGSHLSDDWTLTVASEPATADERAALQWTAGTLQEIVSGRWKGAKESDKVSIGSVTKTVAQVLDMADAALGRASQAAAPAEAREPIYQSRLLKAPAWTDVSHTEFEACAAKPEQFETRTLSRVTADAGEAVAYLVTGGRIFKDKPFLSKEAAEQSVRERNDGAGIKPLGVIDARAQGAQGGKGGDRG